MASIQQSLNALVGAGLGIATSGSYLYSQSPTYKAKQYEAQAENIRKVMEDADFAPEVVNELIDKARNLEVQAAITKPTKTRTEMAKSELEQRTEELEFQEMAKQQKQRTPTGEEAALTRLTDLFEQHFNQISALEQRKSLLSAKERNQLNHLEHIADKKMKQWEAKTKNE